jgi:hypothetical protein
MASSGYTLPGVQITEITQTATPNASSSQRKPCFIGAASAYKRESNEEITRGSTGAVDQLAYYATGIYEIESAGTQIGLNDLVEDTDFTIDTTTGEISWITNTETRTISGATYGADLLTSFTHFSAVNTAVAGVAATGGYQEVGLDVVHTSICGLVGSTYYFTVNGTEYHFTITSTGAETMDYDDVVTEMNTALIGAGVTASFVTNDIRVTHDTGGTGNNIALTAGSSGTDLFSSLTGWDAFDTAVPGADATSGYQELGMTIAGSGASGLSAASRYYFKVNGTEYSILTVSTLTYTAIAALMDTAVTAAGFTIAVVGTDIRITNDTTGTSSTVAVTSGTAKAASNGQMEFTLSSGLIHARTAGYASISATVGASTYTFGIADDITPADTTINLSGTASELNALIVGTVLTITTVPKVAEGGLYYVTYTYNRPTTDYKYKEFSSYQDVLEDLGDCIPANQLVMIADLALNWYGVPTIATIQVPPSNQNSDYVAALQKCKHRDIQTLGVLNNSGTVRNAVIAHVNERNLPQNGRYRMYYTGAAALTDLGATDEANSVCGIAYSLRNEAVVFINATRATYYYKDPTTKLDTATTVDGAFIGAAIGAYRDSFSYASQTILRHTIPGLELFEDDFEDYYTDDMLKLAGGASALVCGLGSDSALLIKDDLTTDNTSVEKNNINIITAKHYIAKDVAIQLDRTFIGRLITNRPVYKQTVEKFLNDVFKDYLSKQIIEEIDSISVTLPTTRRDTVNFKYSYFSVYTNKYFEGEYSLSV